MNTKKYIDQLKKQSIPTKTTKIRIGCNSCTTCCYDQDTLLTGLDLFNIAKHLNLEPKQVIKDFCFVYEGRDSKLPIVTLRQAQKDKACIYLDQANKQCQIYEVRPIVCKLYPFGRFYDPQSHELIYFEQPTSCKGLSNRKVYTLENYLDNNNINEDLEKLWNQLIMRLAMWVVVFKRKKISQSEVIIILEALYKNYDIKGNYKEQLDSNIKYLEQTLEGFRLDIH